MKPYANAAPNAAAHAPFPSSSPSPANVAIHQAGRTVWPQLAVHGMANAETDLQQRIRLALGTHPLLRLFRNNSGSLPDPRTGRYVQFGVASPGGSDLIGWRSIVVTPDMVGHRVAVFTAIEVKTSSGRATPAQRNFIHTVTQAGGFAGIARSVADAVKIAAIDGFPSTPPSSFPSSEPS